MPFEFANNEDLIGKRINDILIIGMAGYRGDPPRMYYEVQCCRCGKIFEMRRNKFTDKVHPPVACYECMKNKYSDPAYIEEIIGKKINMLTCEKFVGFKELQVKGRNKPRRYAMYLCRCDCGGSTVLDRNVFLKGEVKSCGCQNKIGLIKHEDSHTKLYKTWLNMKSRCYNPNATRYEYYGGRGIKVCDEWLDPNVGYMKFRDWALANGYQDDLSIDRIDVDGNYEPSNCRWSTVLEQNWNKSTTRHIEYNGESVTALDLINKFNLSIDTKNLSRRLVNEGGNYSNWSINDKMFVPVGVGREEYRRIHNITTPFYILKK